MNYDEFAFFNRQLAAMLKEGIPLEGAIRQLARGMRAGDVESEYLALEKDLAAGVPFSKAIDARAFPELYRRLLRVGVSGNDLPGLLNLIADHYDRNYSLWTRLKGLLVYPAIVLVVSLGLTVLVSLLFGRMLHLFTDQQPGLLYMQLPLALQPPWVFFSIWMPPILIGGFVIVVLLLFSNRRSRAWLRWRLPGFKEASLAQLASALSLTLYKGTPLPDALRLGEALEQQTPAAAPLAQWRKQLEQGQGAPAAWKSAPPFPPLFLWVVQQAGADLAGGFRRAADLYQRRANYRVEMLLYGVLPVSILLLAQMILWQVAPLFQTLIWVMNNLGNVS